ncbi:ThrRS/AlaRS common domain-containing protein [Pseudovirgaria hyperparasitica]|uniref:ThrRS/AlaRS common domain-containing protein n=1 Tax=Pseudovirgaria hyperparasitica TaxID=470096 RepID=A0A6A6VU38_9PEZI|nr:ThrRS/AlaRS common domain-containing protein [Pseudovirgaria hyperparasitica]KAF2753306.1 ThrRS/AlaRS common domain-containing protein [Pseudovirgaria hyperparasitica]
MTDQAPTIPSPSSVYLHDASIHILSSTLTSLTPFSSIPELDQALFKSPPADSYILTTDRTIFYPQGGGQPADTGTIRDPERSSFVVSLVRSSVTKPTRILHLGTFPLATPSFQPSSPLIQEIDAAKRALHSRWHTAGHILALAAHQILPSAGLIDGKASHVPGSANVEFKGTIPSEYKSAIEARANELGTKDTAVYIHWWNVETMREKCQGGCEGLEDMLAGNRADGDTSGLLRAVEIEGVGSYPCGGTHLPRTSDVGRIEIRKIARKSGICRVSYAVF